MSEWTRGLYRLTQVPAIYGAYQRLSGAHRARRRLVEEAFDLESGLRVLDLGCGRGDILPYLGDDVRYLGIDRNAGHVAAANERFVQRVAAGTVRFVQGDFGTAGKFRGEGYDRILCLGFLHHLDDHRVRELAALTASVLAPDGWLITVDPAYVSGQHPIARKLAQWDSGRSVRSPAGYRDLLAETYETVETQVHHDFLWVPYTHCVVRSTAPLVRSVR